MFVIKKKKRWGARCTISGMAHHKSPFSSNPPSRISSSFFLSFSFLLSSFLLPCYVLFLSILSLLSFSLTLFPTSHHPRRLLSTTTGSLPSRFLSLHVSITLVSQSFSIHSLRRRCRGLWSLILKPTTIAWWVIPSPYVLFLVFKRLMDIGCSFLVLGKLDNWCGISLIIMLILGK